MSVRQRPKTIASMSALRRIVPILIRDHGNDPQITLAALANPILTLEKLGYTLAPELKQEVEFRVRFSTDKAQKLSKLRQEVFQAAGESFDIDSPPHLSRVLRKVLKRRRVAADMLIPQVGWGSRADDPLSELSGEHPIMKPLLEYRRLEASEPRLASEQVFQDVFEGKRKLPVSISNIKFKLKASKVSTTTKKG